MWYELDVSLSFNDPPPTENYTIVYEHLDTAPYLAAETVPEGESSRALILIPGETYPYGSASNFRMELAGDFFCVRDAEDGWFAEDTSQPFVDDPTQRVAVTDLDGDGHDDLVFNAGGPRAYLGETVMIKPTWFELFLKYPPHRKLNYRIYRSVLGRSFRNFWH